MGFIAAYYIKFRQLPSWLFGVLQFAGTPPT
jgi:hypothetical protein